MCLMKLFVVIYHWVEGKEEAFPLPSASDLFKLKALLITLHTTCCLLVKLSVTSLSDDFDV